jgi:hypothetical protein
MGYWPENAIIPYTELKQKAIYIKTKRRGQWSGHNGNIKSCFHLPLRLQPPSSTVYALPAVAGFRASKASPNRALNPLETMGRDSRSCYCKGNTVLNPCLLKMITLYMHTARANGWECRKLHRPCTRLPKFLFFVVYRSDIDSHGQMLIQNSILRWAETLSDDKQKYK